MMKLASSLGRTGAALRVAVFAALGMGATLAAAQSLTFTSGQNVSPAYEGWELAADGTKYCWISGASTGAVPVPVAALCATGGGGGKGACEGAGAGTGRSAEPAAAVRALI